MRRIGILCGLLGALLLPAPAGASLGPYRGLGAWIDLFDHASWAAPERAVARLRSHGARTLFLETSNGGQAADLVDPAAIGRFVDAAHAAGMAVVAWYLPGLTAPALDLRRSLAAVEFRPPAGRGFDGLALDIESTAVKPVARRNARLLALVDAIRTRAPRGYELGAIVPSPVGLALHPRFWPRFPWPALARRVAVFLPMAYYTYRPRSPEAVYAYTHDAIAELRAATGDPALPVHAIGGIGDRTSAAQLASFLAAAADCGAIGASLYDAATTSAAGWAGLTRFAPVTGAGC